MGKGREGGEERERGAEGVPPSLSPSQVFYLGRVSAIGEKRLQVVDGVSLQMQNTLHVEQILEDGGFLGNDIWRSSLEIEG